MKNLNKKNKGFTLIEILVVIGIIAILAAIVIVAINPKKHFDDAKAAQRDANLNTILNAMGQYLVDNKGNLPDFMDETDNNGGTDSGVSDNDNYVGVAREVDTALCNVLVPEYVGAIPTDPDSDSDGGALAEADCGGIGSGDVAYTVEVLTTGSNASEEITGHLEVCTTLLTDDICITR